MAEISAFKGILYDKSKAGDFASLVAPPYDVLGKADIADYHARSPYNIVHLTKPSGEEPYAHSAELFRQWLAEGVLAEDESPAVYVYQQKFIDPDTGMAVPERVGLICALKLEEYASGKVIPHENTITAHRADRLKLQIATKANLESIYGLYSDPDREVESLVRQFADHEVVIESVGEIAGSSHRVSRVNDPNAISVLAGILRDKPVFIADGHHRYETALAYRAQGDGNPLSDYILITLTAFEDEGLLVLPTHRLVTGVDADLVASLPSRLGATGFNVKAISLDEAAARTPHSYGFAIVTAAGAYDVSPIDDGNIVGRVPGHKSKALKSLNVTILHALAIEQILGVPMDSLATTDKVTYTRDPKEAFAKVASGDVQAAFLLARPTVEQVQEVAAEGEKMPQKSTFFFPKLLSGLVMRDLSAN